MKYLYKLYAMVMVPILEKEIVQIDKDISLRERLITSGADNSTEVAVEIYNLKVAKAYTTHKCDRIGGWM